MAAAMAERVVEDRAFALRLDIHDRVPVLRPLMLVKAGRFARKFGVEQDMKIAMPFQQIQLVRRLERLDAAGQRVIGVGDIDPIGRDRRMGDELAAQCLHHQRCPARAAIEAIVEQAQHRIGAVQRIPAAAIAHPLAQRFLRGQGRHHVAGIGDEHVGGENGVEMAIILEHASPHARVFAQQLQQFQPGEVHVVIQAADDQHAIDAGGLLFAHHPVPFFRIARPW